MASLRLYLLGRFRVRRDGLPLALGRRTPRRLLELLQAVAVLGPRDASRARVVGAVWPDAEGDAGDHAFEIALHRLRRLVGVPAALVLDHGHVGLDRAHVWLDVEAFEAAVDAVERAGRDAPRPATAFHALLDEVLALYTGPLLQQQDDLPWLLPARERVRSRFVRAIDAGATILARAGNVDAAADALARAIEIEPLAEGLHRLLIGIHARAGRRAEALSAYRRCTRLLADVHGVPPCAETERALRGE